MYKQARSIVLMAGVTCCCVVLMSTTQPIPVYAVGTYPRDHPYGGAKSAALANWWNGFFGEVVGGAAGAAAGLLACPAGPILCGAAAGGGYYVGTHAFHYVFGESLVPDTVPQGYFD